LFRRLAAFMGGFDLVGAQSVCGGVELERYQVLDQLALLVDKSLVVADESGSRTRYRLLETMRQYALEKLGESGDADVVRTRHRDYYTALAARLDAPADGDYEQRIEQANTEIDNLRAAFSWSRENSDSELALELASSLQPLWQARGRLGEGLTWFDTALADLDAHQPVARAVRARALADRAVVSFWVASAESLDQAQQALAIAREVNDTALLARALNACGYIAAYLDPEAAGPYLAEAIDLARDLGDRLRVTQILVAQVVAAMVAQDPVAARAAAEEGRDLADAIGDRFDARRCRWYLGVAQLSQGDLAGAAAQFAAVADEADAAHDVIWRVDSLVGLGIARAYQGDTVAARAAADAAVDATVELGGLKAAAAQHMLALAAMAAGDTRTAQDAIEAARPHVSAVPHSTGVQRVLSAQAALAGGDLVAARRWADDAVSRLTSAFLTDPLTTRARVAIAQGEPDQAERDAHDALMRAAEVEAYLYIPDILECLAILTGSNHEAARLLGAAHAIRQRMGAVRFKVYDAGYEASVAALRDAMNDNDFESAWAEGAALSTVEAIAYAKRGRGERKRPTSGWASLTPTELDVVRLVTEGLSNNDIATRLFVSPRTVQSHLTHVYTKLGLSSRVLLVQEAGRHT
jgi:DNA-binding CsgD family transcriptional regulator